MSRRSNASDSNNSMAKCDDSFNDSVHLNDLWFYGPPKKRQMLSPRDSQGDVVLPSVSVLGSKVKLAHLNTLENMLSLMAEVEVSTTVSEKKRKFCAGTRFSQSMVE
ncbi:unnamed protein product [Haemonchus placei]|uniref:SCHIP-1 domain-containing protein n=1 Tax=Haemonchus placei TaxID=6290 RepID=A0A0N4WY85_HAEPC|nr:unnamed protein product [Haemonchus placei]